MKKLKHDFKKPKGNQEDYYDLYEDWVLVESSLAKQYGIRIRTQSDMPWTEFCMLVAGLMPDTPLGAVVSIRSEKDKKVIKNFSSDQRRIHNDWKSRNASKMMEQPDKLKQDFADLEKMIGALYK